MEQSAGMVLFRERNRTREYILLQYSYVTTFWGFSKGIIESGEKELQAALREVTEETGLSNIEVIPGFLEKTQFFKRREGKLVYKEVTWFLGRVLDQHNGRISSEHTALKWLSYEEALRMLKHKNDKELLKKAEERLNKS